MFNSISINIDSVEFEYIANGNLEVISVGRPDGIGYSQWSGVWEAFVEFLEEGKTLDQIKDEIEDDALENSNTSSEQAYNEGWDAGYDQAVLDGKREIFPDYQVDIALAVREFVKTNGFDPEEIEMVIREWKPE